MVLLFECELVITVQLFAVLCVKLSSSTYDYYYDQKPLFLTPYLEDGNALQAQNLSQNDVGGRRSYSGYFTTDANCGNNLFMWFFPAEINWNSAPVLLWLNGGPGSTSMFGLFVEVGPWDHLQAAGFVKNNYTWTRDHNVLFIDQPVGTGFSFTERDCYATNLTEVTSNIYNALTQFFTMFSNLQKNSFFITGESFAGNYDLELAVKIHKENQVVSSLKINLVGVLIGNPVLDLACRDQTNLLYELGIVDVNERNSLIDNHKQVIQAIKAKNYSEAVDIYNKRFYAGLPSEYNIIYDENVERTLFEYTLFIRDIKTRDSIHVGYTPFFSYNELVNSKLGAEGAKSQGPNIEYLLKTGKYIVGFYTGQLDTEVPVTSVSCVLSSLQWAGSQEYLNANRTAWRVSGRLAGWTKTAGNLLEVVVRGAGHYVPYDQGEAALDLIKTVVSSKPGSLAPFGQ